MTDLALDLALLGVVALLLASALLVAAVAANLPTGTERQ